MSALTDFLKQCPDLPTGDEFSFFVDDAIVTLATADLAKEKNDLLDIMHAANKSGSINTMAIGIQKCLDYCSKKTQRVTGAKNDKVLLSFITLLKEISGEIQNVINQPDPHEADDSELNNLKTIIESYDAKLKEVQGQLKNVSYNVTEQTAIFDSKFFQLLVNTISILGIFVAIAFAGFGGVTLISNIEVILADDFMKGVFSVFLLALFIYNLLFMLIYFIYTILRNFYTGYRFPRFASRRTEGKLSLLPFIIIDIVLLVVTVVLFFVAK